MLWRSSHLALALFALSSAVSADSHGKPTGGKVGRRAPSRSRNINGHAEKRVKEFGVSGGQPPEKRGGLAIRAALSPTWTYIGCVQDGAARVLTGASYSSTSMTISACQSYCANAGYALAGLECESPLFFPSCGLWRKADLGRWLSMLRMSTKTSILSC
jgi:hypothetical protein